MAVADQPSDESNLSGDAASKAATAADDLDATRKAVEDAASVSGGLWLSYLLMLFYLAIAAATITHQDLFLETPIKLPFLGIELPLLWFFFVAPLLFLIVHAYTLVHFVFLGKKSVQFHESLYTRYPTATTAAISVVEDQHNREIRDRIRLQLPSNIFVQFLAGPSDIRDSGFGWLLRFIAWMTLIFAPVALLLELQIQFLPYHGLLLTWEHRLALLADIILIWWLWEKILGDGGGFRNWKAGRARERTAIGIVFSIAVLWLSYSVAVIPGEWQAFAGCGPLYRMLFHGMHNPNTHRLTSLFSNVLVLPNLNVYASLKIDDPQKMSWRRWLLSEDGRDLKGAIFDGAVLERTFAQKAQLQGASLSFARLQGSNFDEAILEGADLSNAQLQGASLIRAQLQGAELSGAGLQGARLQSADLVAADMVTAQLQGANLRNADLRGANLTLASIRGTSFASVNKNAAKLDGATFDQATLDTVSWNGVRLWQASFVDSKIANVFGTPTWTQDPNWGPNEYARLQNDLQTSLNAASAIETQSNVVLDRIKRIACAKPPLAPVCVSPSPLPPEVIPWQAKASSATVDQATYEKALAVVYTNIICSGDGNSLAIFRSLANMGMPQAAGGTPTAQGFLETGSEAKALAEYVMSKDCPVSAQFTDADKAVLLAVERFVAPTADNNTGLPHSMQPN
jgi:uncharacterized protein YjbI with pentapeptide repeats